MPVQTIVMIGYGKLPQASASKTLSDSVAIAIRFEVRYGVILSADATLATNEGRTFVSEWLVGRSLGESPDDAERELQERFFGLTHSAILAAAKDLYRKYAAWRMEFAGEPRPRQN